MKWMTKTSIILALAFVVMVSHVIVVPAIVFSAQDGLKAPSGKLAVIKSVSLSGEGDTAELVIKLSSPATYTSYKTTAPLRLVLDLSQASEGVITSPLVFNKGNFKTVTANRFDTDAGVLTRIDIELNYEAEAVIAASTSNPGELRISFPGRVAAKIVSESSAPAPKPTLKPVVPVQLQSDTKPVSEPISTQQLPVSKSRKLTAISVIKNTVVLSVDGGVGEFSTFRLNKPERLIIDLFDTQFLMNSRIIPLNAAGVSSARIGMYPDKVRVVLDSVDESFPEASTVKSEQGLTVSLKIKAKEYQDTNKVSPIPAKPMPAVVKPVEVKKAEVRPAPAPVAPVVKPVEVKEAEVKPIPVPVAPVIKSVEVKEAEVKPVPVPVAYVVKPVEAEAPVIKPIEPETTVAKPVATQPPPVKIYVTPAKTKTVIKPVAPVPASVEMIDFQVIENISRVSVKVSGDVSVEPPVKTTGFVTLTIKKATLSRHLQRSLEAQSFISPVLRITPLLIKTSKGNDTKIRIAMRAAAPYEFRQEGDMLYVDFKNPDGLTADKLPAAILETRTDNPRTAKTAAVNTTKRDADLASELTPAPEIKVYGTQHVYRGRKVTLEFADAEVRKIFQLLSEVSNKNFVLGDDVTGTISIKLVNVPWDQALDIILDTKGLDKREDGNIIIIKGKGKFKSQAEEEQDIKKVQLRSEPQYTEYFPINYSTVDTMKAQADSVLTTNIGKSYADARTNTLIITSVKSDIERVRDLLKKLDVPEKQVMIEARIVEASSSFTRSLGVNWGLHYRDGSGSFLGINQLNSNFGGVASTIPSFVGTNGQAGGSMGISFGTLTSNIQLDLRLNAAASAGLIKIVSTPKVATLNNKTAKITQGQQVPYTSSTSDKVETKFVEAALALEVTPHINANGTIVMKIDAKNDSVGQVPAGATAPSINKKQATTEMLLRDGETTVIGGIYVDSDNDSEDGVPYLMDIPFLGKLFKSSNKTKVKTELLIFITPRILNSI